MSLAPDGTLNPGVVTNAQLDNPTQATIASVAGKYTKPGSGIPSSDLAGSVQASLNLASTAVQTSQLGATNGVATLTGTTLTGGQLPSAVASSSTALTYVLGTPTGVSSHDTPLIQTAIATAGNYGTIVLGPGNWQLNLGIIGSSTQGVGYKFVGAGPYSTILSPVDNAHSILSVTGPGNTASDYFELENLGVCLPFDMPYSVPLINVSIVKGMFKIGETVRFYTGSPTNSSSSTSYTGTMLVLDGAYEGVLTAEFRNGKYAIPWEMINVTEVVSLGVPPNMDTFTFGGTIDGVQGGIVRSAYYKIHGLRFQRYKTVATVFYGTTPWGETTVATAGSIGDTSIVVSSTMQQVSMVMPIVGDCIGIGVGGTYEINKVTSVTISGSNTILGLTQPLRFAQAIGTTVHTGGRAVVLGDNIYGVTFDAFHFESQYLGITAGAVAGIYLGSGQQNQQELVRQEGATSNVVFAGPILSFGTSQRHVWLKNGPANSAANSLRGGNQCLMPPVAPNPLPGYYIQPDVFYNVALDYRQRMAGTPSGSTSTTEFANTTSPSNTASIKTAAFAAGAGGTALAQILYSGQGIFSDGATTKFVSAAGKTTVADTDFTVTPTDGTMAVHYDSTASKTYLSVRANGTWHVMAGPV